MLTGEILLVGYWHDWPSIDNRVIWIILVQQMLQGIVGVHQVVLGDLHVPLLAVFIRLVRGHSVGKNHFSRGYNVHIFLDFVLDTVC